LKLTSRLIIITQLTLLLSAGFCLAEDYYVTKVSGMMRDSEYKAMSRTDYDALVQKIKKETSLFSKAHKMAELEWNKQEEAGRYPGRSLHPRKVTKIKTYKSMADAENDVLKKEESIKRSAQKKVDREKKSKQGRGRNRRNNNDKSKKRREASEKERDAKIKLVHEYFMKEMNKLLSTEPAKQSTNESKKGWY